MLKSVYPLLFLFFLLVSSSVTGITFGGAGNDHGYELIKTSDSGFALLGQYGNSSQDIYIVKLDSSGSIQWSKIYGSAGDDYAGYISQTPDHGFLIGATKSQIGGNLSAWLLRLNSSGDTLWTRTYGNDPNAIYSAVYVGNSSADSYTVGITETPFSSGEHLYLVHTDTLGNITDTITTGSTCDIVLPVVNGYLLTGINNAFSPLAISLVRADTVGGNSFTKSFFDPSLSNDMSAYSSAVCGTGFLTAGSTNLFSSNPANYEFFLIKTDSIGDSLWTRHWGNDFSELTSIIHDNNNQYFASGYTGLAAQRNNYIMKIDSAGDTLWTKNLGHNINVNSMVLTGNGGFAAIGDSLDTLSNFTDAWFMLFDSLGNETNIFPTGISMLAETNNFVVSVYPNPAKATVEIDLGINYYKMTGCNLSLVNPKGHLLLSKKIKDRKISVDLNQWADNIFFLFITNSQGRTVAFKKILKN